MLYDNWESVKQDFDDPGYYWGLPRIKQVIIDALVKPLEQLLG